MTDKRREAMRRYRELAVQCERRLHAKRTGRPSTTRPSSSFANPAKPSTPCRPPPTPPPDFHAGVDCLLVTSLLEQQQRYAFAASVVAEVCNVVQPITAPAEVTSATTSFEAEADDADASTTLGNVSDITTDQPTEENDDLHSVGRNDGDTNDGDRESVSSDSSSPHTATYVLNVPTDSQAAPSGDLTDQEQELVDDAATRPPLIRSNSYTLLTPSPAFLKHLQSQGLCLNDSRPSSSGETDAVVKPPTPPTPLISVHSESHVKPTAEQLRTFRPTSAMRHGSCGSLATGTSKAPAAVVVTKTTGTPPCQRTRRPSFERIYGAKGPANPIKKVTPSASQLQLQRLRRLYDPKSGTPKTTVRPQSMATGVNVPDPIAAPVSPSTGRTSLTRTPPAQQSSASVATSTEDNSSTSTTNLMQLIARMEADRRHQMDELIARQELEQQRQQAAFMQQQQLLVQQITAHCTSMIDQLAKQQQAAVAVSPMQSQSAAPAAIVDAGAEDVNNITCISSSTLSLSAGTLLDPSIGQRPKTTQRRLFADARQAADEASCSREWRAATRINACVRGYLTRRLFRTEDVQTVVQVIRDTLLFVVDLYREQQHQQANGGPVVSKSAVLSETDANLRRSLLKQVCEKCVLNYIHLISNDTPFSAERLLLHAARHLHPQIGVRSHGDHRHRSSHPVPAPGQRGRSSSDSLCAPKILCDHNHPYEYAASRGGGLASAPVQSGQGYAVSISRARPASKRTLIVFTTSLQLPHEHCGHTLRKHVPLARAQPAAVVVNNAPVPVIGRIAKWCGQFVEHGLKCVVAQDITTFYLVIEEPSQWDMQGTCFHYIFVHIQNNTNKQNCISKLAAFITNVHIPEAEQSSSLVTPKPTAAATTLHRIVPSILLHTAPQRQ